MAITENILNRIEALVSEGSVLAESDNNAEERGAGWMAAVENVIRLVCDDPQNPYRASIDVFVKDARNYSPYFSYNAGKITGALRHLLIDAKEGLLVSVADRSRAEVFDDFLDHADAYLTGKQKNEAGVIAGVVFEDTIRRICRKIGLEETGQKLDELISKLQRERQLTSIKAKRARAAAGVRTKASHAQWEEFEANDVRATIEICRELISSKLDG